MATNDMRFCSALSCPRIQDATLSVSALSSGLTPDSSGNPWCDQCEKQRTIMDWAYTHHWPSVRVQSKMRYAVSGDASGWFLSIVGANQDMIDALHETLIEGKRARLPAIEEEE